MSAFEKLRVPAGVLCAAYVGWILYMTVHRGVDAGVGVLVSWPALILLAALVLAPLIALGVLVVRLVRHRSAPSKGAASKAA